MSVGRALLLYAAGTAIRARDACGLAPRTALRVLLYHDIPARERGRFAATLRAIAESWRFATPAEFEAMVAGRAPVHGRNVLLTFDDGFSSNRTLADEVLRPMQIQAVFFVVPEFVGIADRARARKYIAERIQPGTDERALDPGLANMQWDDLAALLGAGHTIGAHTMSHARLSAIADDTVLTHEIVSCAEVITARLGVTPHHFAYPFGNIASMTDRAMSIAARHYGFVHSGVRGDNRGASPLALRRDALTPIDSRNVVNAFLGGATDGWYASGRATLDRWAARADESSR